MQVLGRAKIADACQKHSQWKASLEGWYKIASEADWRHFADLRQTWKNVDQVGKCVVFNISHNKWRLIAHVSYANRRLIVLHGLSHAEYDQERWKNGCGA